MPEISVMSENCECTTKAKFLHCVRTVRILCTQRLGYSPKNTCHLSSSTAKCHVRIYRQDGGHTIGNKHRHHSSSTMVASSCAHTDSST